MEFFPEIHISAPEAEAIARGLFAVARAEGGVHEREAALIRGFYADVDGDARALAALENAPAPEPEALALALSSNEVRMLFLKTAYLVAWADGGVADAERALIEQYAGALGVEKEALSSLEQGVKEFLVGQLLHLSDVETTRKVAQKLSL